MRICEGERVRKSRVCVVCVVSMCVSESVWQDGDVGVVCQSKFFFFFLENPKCFNIFVIMERREKKCFDSSVQLTRDKNR